MLLQNTQRPFLVLRNRCKLEIWQIGNTRGRKQGFYDFFKVPYFHKYSTSSISEDSQTEKIVDKHLRGTELYKEMRKLYGPAGIQSMRQMYSEQLLKGEW